MECWGKNDAVIVMDVDEKSQKRQKMPTIYRVTGGPNPQPPGVPDAQLAAVAPFGASSSSWSWSPAAADALPRKARAVVIVKPAEWHTEGCEERDKVFDDLCTYLGGCEWSRVRYESVFGKVSEMSPFGDQLWDGIIKQWRAYYNNDKYFWCAESTYVPWLGGFHMPENFSKKTAALPVSASIATSWPSDHFYPAVFVLTHKQVAIIKSHVNVDAPTNVIRGTGTMDLAAVGQSTIDDEDDDDDDEPGVDNVCFIDGSIIGPLYMVCLKIMVHESKPWAVHMDRVHLYTPMSRL